MLSCLPWLASGLTTNWTLGSDSTDLVGSTVSASNGLITVMHECDACINEMPRTMQE